MADLRSETRNGFVKKGHPAFSRKERSSDIPSSYYSRRLSSTVTCEENVSIVYLFVPIKRMLRFAKTIN